jgi:uncharacterized protein
VTTKQARALPVHLLDGNVLVALMGEEHVHHQAAVRWFSSSSCAFATCPITQGTLLRLLIKLADLSPASAVQVLAKLTQHPRHRFWPDTLDYSAVSWRGVLGHRQVTDAYLAALARAYDGKLVSFDHGLVALHADVAVGLNA